MGLISSVVGTAVSSATGVFNDQWLEYFYCDSLPSNVLVRRGMKKDRKGNNKGDDNVISNGSCIAIADGQCMMIVDQGKVVDICAEPGEYTYDMSSEPSVFCGGLAANMTAILENIGKRFSFAGEVPKDQRVYYFNIKELIGNKYGTPSPVPFRVVDERAGIDIDISIKCFGEYSYKITNPPLFYANVCGNVSRDYRTEDLDSQLKSELLTALQPAFARISEQGVRYSALPGHTTELAEALKSELSAKWKDYRGIEIQNVGVSSVKADEEDEKMIKEMQKNAAYTNQNLAAATMVGATAQAMQTAAGNSGGAAVGFMGMNMAGQAGGINTQALYQAGAQQQAQPAADTWTCPSCGKQASGNFCPECGGKKPEAPAKIGVWKCSECGAENSGKFCAQCGAKKPEGALQYKCDKCGWVPEDPANPPRFCPECGDPFGDEDKVE